MKSSYVLSSDYVQVYNQRSLHDHSQSDLDEVFAYEEKRAKIEQEKSFYDNVDDYIGKLSKVTLNYL